MTSNNECSGEDPLLSITAPFLGEVRFFSIEEIHKWVLEHTRDLAPLVAGDGNARVAIQKHLQRASGFATKLSEENAASLLPRIKSEFTTWPHSTSPVGRRAIELAKSSAEAAGYFYTRFSDPIPYDVNQRAALAGAVLAALYELPMENAPSVENSIAAIATRAQSTADSALHEIRRTAKEISETLEIVKRENEAVISRAMTTYQDGLVGLSKLAEDRIAEVRNKADESCLLLDAARKRFETELKLRPAVEYWKEKATRHRISGWAWFIATLFAIIGVAWLIWHHAQTTSGELPGMREPGSPDSLRMQFYVGIAIRISTVALLVWLIRIFLKFSQSHFHLQEDAIERATISTAYLAILKDEAEAGAKDFSNQAFVFQAIFRHVPFGMNKDDTAPAIFSSAPFWRSD